MQKEQAIENIENLRFQVYAGRMFSKRHTILKQFDALLSFIKQHKDDPDLNMDLVAAANRLLHQAWQHTNADNAN